MNTKDPTELYRVANQVIATIHPLYLSQDDTDDLRQEIVVAILSAEAKVDQTLNPDLFLFIAGLFGGRKYLARHIWNLPDTVDVFGIETGDIPDPNIDAIDEEIVVDLLAGFDPYGWVAKYYGINTEPLSIAQIALMEGMTRQNVHQHIKRQLRNISRHLGRD